MILLLTTFSVNQNIILSRAVSEREDCILFHSCSKHDYCFHHKPYHQVNKDFLYRLFTLHRLYRGTWVIPICCTKPSSAENRLVPVHLGLFRINHGTTYQSISTFLLFQIYEKLTNPKSS